ncbi:MAG TPA: methionyl-tRNA formyltransferase [Candidatus Wolfebacteria bacterium]|nr:methionyl-tRNA formyltransferase [Candidatus Wolfebacteria bacterium]
MLHNSRFIFFGTPEFASIILEKLINTGYVPEAVVCNPDKPFGRKKIITPPPIKQRIMNYELRIKDKIKILQPEKLSIIHDSLFKIQPDLFIVAAYAKIIPKEILEIPRLGTIGVHPSLLPKYRGSSPIQITILNGDEETGTTLYLMDEGLDSGPILAQRELKNYESRIMNYGELHKKLAELSAELLIETLPKFFNNEITPQAQDEKQATFTKKFQTEDGYIKFEDLKKAQEQGNEIALVIDRKIRALNPEPGVYTLQQIQGKQKRIKLLEAKITDEKLELLIVQPEGKKPMPWKNLIKNFEVPQMK